MEEVKKIPEVFVSHGSIVREIWGKADTVLFIFAGAAAEFAMNPSVDWLYFTGQLPADPLGRLFSTVDYAGRIIFSPENDALLAIDRINAIHSSVETSRGKPIPAVAYRDVLFMLIHYSISSFELLERKLSPAEKDEVVDVFRRVGERMHISQLPRDHSTWWMMYLHDSVAHLKRSRFTKDLFQQYRKHLGPARYLVMKETQKALLTTPARKMLRLAPPVLIYPLLAIYKLGRLLHADQLLKTMLVPADYKQKISALDRFANQNG